MLAYANALQRIGSGVTRSLVTIPLRRDDPVVLGSTVAFAMPTTGEQRRLKHWMLGSAHGLAHIGLGFVGAKIWLLLPLYGETFPLPLTSRDRHLPAAVALVASAVVGLYLLIASMFDVNVNELFAAQGIVDTKSFLRMHFAPDGSLTIYAIGRRQGEPAVARQPGRATARPVDRAGRSGALQARRRPGAPRLTGWLRRTSGAVAGTRPVRGSEPRRRVRRWRRVRRSGRRPGAGCGRRVGGWLRRESGLRESGRRRRPRRRRRVPAGPDEVKHGQDRRDERVEEHPELAAGEEEQQVGRRSRGSRCRTAPRRRGRRRAGRTRRSRRRAW
jgi:hypothetical protein